LLVVVVAVVHMLVAVAAVAVFTKEFLIYKLDPTQ
jgi:hypothetical protein